MNGLLKFITCGGADYSLLFDGLIAEREQGCTDPNKRAIPRWPLIILSGT